MREVLLEARGLTKTFRSDGVETRALDNVDITVERGSSVAIVGESGSGKSTFAKIVMQVMHPDSGTLSFAGKDISHLKGKALRSHYRQVQMVMQDPVGSFDPRIRMRDSIVEGACNFGMSKPQALEAAREVCSHVGLKAECLDRYPHEISGGECQRAAIARALLINPSLLIFDEATSALDVSVQAQILNLLIKLHDRRKDTHLVISHDLAVVQMLCDYVIVMRHGEVVEQGSVDEVIHNPQHDYTRQLVGSVLSIGADAKLPEIGEVRP